MGESIIYVIPVFGVIALLYTLWRSSWVSRQEVGTDRMGGIAENIAFGRPDAARAEIIEAAKSANADVFISRLEEG